MNDHGYVYVVVRNDLTTAQKAVQASHAVIDMTRDGYITHDCDHPSVIIVVVKNENKLKKVMDDLPDDIDFIYFREPDNDNEITSFATRPLYGDERDHFKRFQLMID